MPGRRRDGHRCQGHRLLRDGQGPQRAGIRLEARRPHPAPRPGLRIPGTDNRTCNSNNLVRSDEGVAVSHEADPSHGPSVHVRDRRAGRRHRPARAPRAHRASRTRSATAAPTPTTSATRRTSSTPPRRPGEKAVYISDAVVAAETFCDIHVIEHIPGEQRLIAAYYSQGSRSSTTTSTTRATCSSRSARRSLLPNTNTWAAEHFKIRDNADGTRTYFIATNDIHRGVDVVSWTGRPTCRVGAAAQQRRRRQRRSGGRFRGPARRRRPLPPAAAPRRRTELTRNGDPNPRQCPDNATPARTPRGCGPASLLRCPGSAGHLVSTAVSTTSAATPA